MPAIQTCQPAVSIWFASQPVRKLVPLNVEIPDVVYCDGATLRCKNCPAESNGCDPFYPMTNHGFLVPMKYEEKSSSVVSGNFLIYKFRTKFKGVFIRTALIILIKIVHIGVS